MSSLAVSYIFFLFSSLWNFFSRSVSSFLHLLIYPQPTQIRLPSLHLQWNQSYQGQQWWGGDHMFLFAMRVPVRTLSWQIINNFPFTLKKLVHWTTNYMGNKSSNHWPPCLKPHWLLLCSFSTCLKCFLMTSKCWHVARFQLPSPALSVSFFFPLPSLSPHVLQLWYPQVNIASHPSLSTSTALSIL